MVRSELPGPGPRALSIAATLRARLEDLAAAARPITEQELAELFAWADAFHRVLFEESGALPRCGAGCSSCCSQVVFDVHAFEVERLGRHLVASGVSVEELIAALDRRIGHFDTIRREHPRAADESHDAWTERLAVEFWKADLPCVLLDEQGRCSVHELRPWSCRRYFSLSDPQWCRGESAHDPRREGIIVDPFEEIDALLHALDRHVGMELDTDRLDLGLRRWFALRAGSQDAPEAHLESTTLPVNCSSSTRAT